MPGITTAGYPYPLPSDPIKEGADAIKALAERIEDRLGLGIVTGRVVINMPATGVFVNATVTLPAGYFAAASADVSVTLGTNNRIYLDVTFSTATYFQIRANASTGSGNQTVHWLAVRRRPPPETVHADMPFPLGTDQTNDGPVDIQELAQTINDKLGQGIASGRATIPIASQDTSANVTIALPAGRFQQAADVQLTSASNTQAWLNYVNGSATSFSVRGINAAGSANLNIHWIAAYHRSA